MSPKCIKKKLINWSQHTISDMLYFPWTWFQGTTHEGAFNDPGDWQEN